MTVNQSYRGPLAVFKSRVTVDFPSTAAGVSSPVSVLNPALEAAGQRPVQSGDVVVGMSEPDFFSGITGFVVGKVNAAGDGLVLIFKNATSGPVDPPSLEYELIIYRPQPQNET